MPLYRKTEIPNMPDATQDVFWAIDKATGKGSPITRGVGLQAQLKPGDLQLIKDGLAILDKARVLVERDQLEIDGGTAVREIDGSISWHDSSIVNELAP